MISRYLKINRRFVISCKIKIDSFIFLTFDKPTYILTIMLSNFYTKLGYSVWFNFTYQKSTEQMMHQNVGKPGPKHHHVETGPER